MGFIAPIQADLDGLYYDIPHTLTSMRRGKSSMDVVEEIEGMKRDLLQKAKDGNLEAIQTLKERYKIKTFIHRGKKII